MFRAGWPCTGLLAVTDLALEGVRLPYSKPVTGPSKSPVPRGRVTSSPCTSCRSRRPGADIPPVFHDVSALRRADRLRTPRANPAAHRWGRVVWIGMRVGNSAPVPVPVTRPGLESTQWGPSRSNPIARVQFEVARRRCSRRGDDHADVHGGQLWTPPRFRRRRSPANFGVKRGRRVLAWANGH